MALPGVTIGSYHCKNNWGCYLAEKEIGFPEMREHKVEIPGRDGFLDLTDYLTGGPKFGNREIKIKLLRKSKYDTWGGIVRLITRSIHGKRLNVCFEDDPSMVYTGRCMVSGVTPISKYSCYIDITVDADPYAHASSATLSKTYSISATEAANGTSKSQYANVTVDKKYIPFVTATTTGKYSITIRCDGADHVFYHNPSNGDTYDFDGFVLIPNKDQQILVTVKSETTSAVSATFKLVEAAI